MEVSRGVIHEWFRPRKALMTSRIRLQVLALTWLLGCGGDVFTAGGQNDGGVTTSGSTGGGTSSGSTSGPGSTTTTSGAGGDGSGAGGTTSTTSTTSGAGGVTTGA